MENREVKVSEALYVVSGSFTSTGLKIVSRDMNVRETDKSYVTENRRIDKSRLMQVDTITYENIWYALHYFTYCLESQIDEAKELVKNKLLSEYGKRINDLKLMNDHYNLLA